MPQGPNAAVRAMRRTPLVVTGTLAGLAGLLTFHSRAASLNLNTLQSGTSSSRNSPSGSSTTPSGSSSSTSTTQPTSQPGSTTTSPNGSSSTTTTSPTPTTSTQPTSAKSATGPVVNYFFGTVSVSVTVSGKKITNIKIASLDDGGNPRSQMIDQQALPMLEQQALAANSANIAGVSGATYTSQGFTQSLQSALSKVGL